MVRKLAQVDNESFLIEWSDGLTQRYTLPMLQGACPCAQCYDPATGSRRNPRSSGEKGVGATKIESVGRYALRVHFTSGCTKGIYSFALLREIGKPGIQHV